MCRKIHGWKSNVHSPSSLSLSFCVRKATQYTNQWICACLSISILHHPSAPQSLLLFSPTPAHISSSKSFFCSGLLSSSRFQFEIATRAAQCQAESTKRILICMCVMCTLETINVHNVICVIFGSFFRSRMLFHPRHSKFTATTAPAPAQQIRTWKRWKREWLSSASKTNVNGRIFGV